jgi:hypothetical protein
MLVWDTETRTDVTQRLTFGSYRFVEDGVCLVENLFRADDLSEAEQRALTQYVRTERADVDDGGDAALGLLSVPEFLKRFYHLAYRGRVLVVAFNAPFDLSRIAHDVLDARGQFAGGFSLGLWSYRDSARRERRQTFRPRLGIKHIDSRRALVGFTARQNPDAVDLIPEGSETGHPERGYKFRGHFLDLKTLAFALTDEGHSLKSACHAFGVENPKTPTDTHGTVTADYIDYNRNDVLATWELAKKLLEEYDRHPIDLPVTHVYSPASIGKAYLRAMGIPPVLERQPDFPKKILGFAQSAFFGGRTSAHIRRVSVPVVSTDFLSMYPTVNSLMGLWQFVTAQKIAVTENCQASVLALLHAIAADSDVLFRPDTWPRLTAFVRLVPDWDVLPIRAKFAIDAQDWQVAVSHVHGGEGDGLWYALPDVVASVILTGRVPALLDAFRLRAEGALSTLTPVRLRGLVPIDPRREDFFRVVIEQRKLLATRKDLTPVERKRLDRALKVLANSTSYGIYAEMHRQESDRVVTVQCQGIDPDGYTCRVAHPDAPGEYCFPPLASLITAAARLMLALLERSVTSRGGTYAMEDTDSMAIVATKAGGVVPCAGGGQRTTDGRAGVRALTWSQVDRIARQFRTLNPYDRRAVGDSILKIEGDNFEWHSTSKRRQLWCLAISAKRYTLFLRDPHGAPVLLRAGQNNERDRWSEHGLGHLLNPLDPEEDDRAWIGEVWRNITSRLDGRRSNPIPFGNLPAIGRLTISSPPLWYPFARVNQRKRYRHQVKPFNFLITAHVRVFGHPFGMLPQHFQLIASYEKDSRRWLSMTWLDRFSTKRFRITTAGDSGDRLTARVSTCAEVIADYEYHPEAKCADAAGRVCDRQTIGLLYRRHVAIDAIQSIGKESNSLEEVEAGVEHDAANVYTEYRDPRRSDWMRKTLPAVKAAKLVALVQACHGHLSRRALIDIRAERSSPHPRNQRLLAIIVQRLDPNAFRGPR